MAASSIYFNGRVTWKPGSYSEVDASGLARPGLGASGIIACIGEAEGGAPYSEAGDLGVHRISSPGKVARTFRSGDLKEAGQIMFDPSKDPDIPGGAQEVVFCKVNPATQSSLTVKDDSAVNNLDFESLDFGAFTNYIAVEIQPGTVGGTLITVYADYDAKVEVFDDLGSDGWFRLALPADFYTTPYGSALTFASNLDPAANFDASWALASMAVDPEPEATIAFTGYSAGSWTNPFVGPIQVSVVSDNAGDTTQTVTVYGLSSGGAPVSEVITLTGTGAQTSSTTWAEVHGFVLSAATVGSIVASHAGGTALVTIGSAAVTLFAGLEASTDGQLEINDGTLKFVSDGASTESVLVVGWATAGGATLEVVTLTGTTAVETTTNDWEWVQYVFAGPVEDGQTVTMSGAIWEDDTTAELVSTSATDTSSIILVGYNGSGTLATETVTLNGTSTVTSTAQFDMLLGAIVADAGNLPAGTVSVKSSGAVVLINGVAGDVSLGSITSGNAAVGSDMPVLLSLTGDNILTYNLSSVTGSNLIVVGEDGDGSAKVVELVLGASGTSTDWGFIAGFFWAKPTLATGTIDALSFVAFDLVATDFEHLAAVEDWFDGFSGLAFTMLSGQGTAIDLTDADAVTSKDLKATAPTFYGIHYDIIETVTAQSVYVAVTAATGASQVPPATKAKTFLAGGGEGTTAFADWQAALDKMKDYRINTVVCLTDSDAVHAASVAHCSYMAGPGKSERDTILGEASAIALGDAKAAALAINSRHARLCIQDIERFNTAGQREVFPPALAAGMQSASPVGTALTWKYVNVLDVTGKDSSYIIRDDADELIRAGLCMIERVPNVGYRFLRNITTYLIDSNPAYTEGGVNEAVNYSVYEFRKSLEAIVGKKAFAGTIAAAEGISTAILGQLVAANVISAYQNLSISIDSDVMEIDVEIAPIQSINFVKSTLHLVSASFSNA